MILVKQSTGATIPLGPFVDEVDGKSAETGLTISQADVRLSKNGGAFAQKNESSASSHMENGIYAVVLDTTDTNTLGRLRIHVHESGALPVWEEVMVLTANTWDTLFGSDRFEVDVKEIDSVVAAAQNLSKSAQMIVLGAAEAGTLSTTQMTTDLAEATDDHYNGRRLIWTSGVLLRQATIITDYLGSTGMLTFVAVTEAPSAADTFIIV